jgi:biotin carboxyl carrier protein
MSEFVVVVDGHRYQVELPSSLTIQLGGDKSTMQQHSTRQSPIVCSALVDGLPVEVVIPDIRDPNTSVQCLFLNDRPVETTIDSKRKWIKSSWGVHTLEVHQLDMTTASFINGNRCNGMVEKGIADNGKANNVLSSNGRVLAPIPGLIVQVKISTGESVKAGQALFILEAMKMENEIRATRSGIIKSIYVSPGQAVALSQILAEID